MRRNIKLKVLISSLNIPILTELTPKQKYGLHLLEERLQDPFRPSSYFALNKSTFLAMFSTSLTYIIILLQFKVGAMTGADSGASGQMRYVI